MSDNDAKPYFQPVLGVSVGGACGSSAWAGDRVRDRQSCGSVVRKVVGLIDYQYE